MVFFGILRRISVFPPQTTVELLRASLAEKNEIIARLEGRAGRDADTIVDLQHKTDQLKTKYLELEASTARPIRATAEVPAIDNSGQDGERIEELFQER